MRSSLFAIFLSGLLVLGAGAAHAEEPVTAPPVADQEKAKMEWTKKMGSPSEGHKPLEALAGNWSYTAQFWMVPGEQAHSMKGTAKNSMIFGGRFLKQEVSGEPMEKEMPPFEGLGLIGYDNMRQEYQLVWFDNMMTGMMRSIGKYDVGTKTLSDQGDFSCPMTGEMHRWYRAAWTVVDKDHTRYESYSQTPDGKEFKSMEILYARAS